MLRSACSRYCEKLELVLRSAFRCCKSRAFGRILDVLLGASDQCFGFDHVATVPPSVLGNVVERDWGLRVWGVIHRSYYRYLVLRTIHATYRIWKHKSYRIALMSMILVYFVLVPVSSILKTWSTSNSNGTNWEYGTMAYMVHGMNLKFWSMELWYGGTWWHEAPHPETHLCLVMWAT